MNVFGVKKFLIQALKFIENALEKFIDKIIVPIFSRYLVHSSIFVGVTVIFIWSFKLEIAKGRAKGFLDIDFWLDNLIPNIIADMIGILLTTFIIAGLFARNTKVNEQKELFNLIGIDFDSLMYTLSKNYLYLLKREERFLLNKYRIGVGEIRKELLNISRDIESIDVFKMEESLQFKMESGLFMGYEAQDKGFISMIPRFQSYVEKLIANEQRTQELSQESGRIEIHLKEIELSEGKMSARYEERWRDLEEAKQKFQKNVEQTNELFYIQKDYEDFDGQEVVEGFINFFNNKVNEFYSKYNFLIPVDMRLSFSKLEKEFSFYRAAMENYYRIQIGIPDEERTPVHLMDMTREKFKKITRRHILSTCGEMGNLMTYFDKVNHYYKYIK